MELIMSKSFLERRLDKHADYDIEVWIRGVRLGKTDECEWSVHFLGEDDPVVAAELLEQAAEVLRQP